MTVKPWHGLVSDEDVGSFRKGVENESRPLTAGQRPAVIVVDMTRQFVDSAYPTGWGPTGWPAVEATRTLLEAARATTAPVIFTKAHADPNYVGTPAERGRWKMSGQRSVPEGTPPGDVIVDELTPIEGEVVIYKGSKPSAFFGTPLTSLLVYAGVDSAIVTGMTTSGCVRATVLDAFMNNLNVIVPYECVADRSQISHKVNLFDMHMKYADVISLAETLDYLTKVGT